MKHIRFALFFAIGLLVITGCANHEVDEVNVRLSNEIEKLEKTIVEKEEEIRLLKEENTNNAEKLMELTKSVEIIRWSANARIEDYEGTFGNLPNIYKIHSNYEVKDDWYVISEESFHIELLEYKDAEKVDFYLSRLESDTGLDLLFTDTDSTDGWNYTNESIGKIINKHTNVDAKEFSYEPYFLLYTQVTLKDGNVITTSKLPIYNR